MTPVCVVHDDTATVMYADESLIIRFATADEAADFAAQVEADKPTKDELEKMVKE